MFRFTYRPALKPYVIPALLSTLITALVAAAFVYERIDHNKNLRRATLESLAASTASWLDNNISRINHTLIDLQHHGQSCNADDLYYIRSQLFALPQIAEFGYISPTGRLRCTSWQEVSPPIQVSKAPNSFGLRMMWPFTVEFMEKPAAVLSRTIRDNGEVYALLRISWLKDQIRGRTSQLGYMAIIDSDTGVPLVLNGQYSLPVGEKALNFPIDYPTTTEHMFDNGRQQFIAVQPLLTMPQLSIAISEETVLLYKNIFSPPPLFFLAVPGLGLLTFMLLSWLQSFITHPAHWLRRAIRQNEFINYYQPMVSSDTQTLKGVEVLMRWQHPLEGLKLPQTFIPEAEHSNLIKQMTKEQLERAAIELAPFIKRQPGFLVHINVSTIHLLDTSSVDTFITMQEKIPALVLEVTEGTMLDHSSTDIKTSLLRLTQAGIRIAVDDFGTGYCGLNYLQSLPVSILKADKSFIASIGTDAVNIDVLDTIVILAKRLRLLTVAEGVETQEQAEKLRAMGIDMQQGWLHSPALPINTLRYNYL